MSLHVPLQRTELPQATIDGAIRLLGFDVGADIFHVLAFDFDNEGGAIGIWREGDRFCARIGLDALADFWKAAKNASSAKGEGDESAARVAAVRECTTPGRCLWPKCSCAVGLSTGW